MTALSLQPFTNHQLPVKLSHGIIHLLGVIMISSWHTYFTAKNKDLSLLGLFKPVYLILALLGLFPFCVQFKTKHKCVIIPRTIYLNSLCAVTVIITILAFIGIRIQDTIHEITSVSVTNDMMTHINYTLEYLFLLASCVTAYVRVYLYRYKIINILNDMASAWLQLPVTRHRILENLRLKIMLLLLSLLVLLIMHIVINFTRKEGLWTEIMVTMIFILPHMVQIVALSLFYVMVLMLVALLTNIEEALKSYQKCVEGSKVEARNALTVNLRSIELVLVKAFEIKREINDAFQATILLTCMQCFHAIVSESHIIYHGTFSTTSLTTHEIINFSVWIIYQLIKMCALAYSGRLLNTVTCRIGQALHNIPTEKLELRAMMEIQHFTSLMSYQATDLTVYGFFPLDASFLFKIVASATMYLIILVQFDNKIK